MDRTATGMNMGVLVPIVPLQLCNCRILLLGSCVPSARPNVPVLPKCWIKLIFGCHLLASASCWRRWRKDVLITVGPGFCFVVLLQCPPFWVPNGSCNLDRHWHEPALSLLFASAPALMQGFPVLCPLIAAWPTRLWLSSFSAAVLVASVAQRCAVIFKIGTWPNSAVLGSWI